MVKAEPEEQTEQQEKEEATGSGREGGAGERHKRQKSSENKDLFVAKVKLNEGGVESEETEEIGVKLETMKQQDRK